VAHKPEEAGPIEHLNIKVTDNNNEVFFKIKRTTALGKLMNAFCDRQGKNISSVRFLFDGTRVGPTDNPDTVSSTTPASGRGRERERERIASDLLTPPRSSTCKTATRSRSTRSKSAVPASLKPACEPTLSDAHCFLFRGVLA